MNHGGGSPTQRWAWRPLHAHRRVGDAAHGRAAELAARARLGAPLCRHSAHLPPGQRVQQTRAPAGTPVVCTTRTRAASQARPAPRAHIERVRAGCVCAWGRLLMRAAPRACFRAGFAAHVHPGVFVRHVHADQAAPGGQLRRTGMVTPLSASALALLVVSPCRLRTHKRRSRVRGSWAALQIPLPLHDRTHLPLRAHWCARARASSAWLQTTSSRWHAPRDPRVCVCVCVCICVYRYTYVYIHEHICMLAVVRAMRVEAYARGRNFALLWDMPGLRTHTHTNTHTHTRTHAHTHNIVCAGQKHCAAVGHAKFLIIVACACKFACSQTSHGTCRP